MTKKGQIIAVDKGGRPTKINKKVVAKLVSVFKLDVSIDTACVYAGIDKTTYHRNYKKKLGFAMKMDSARDYARIKAGRVVETAIEGGDVATARWWLEKKHSGEFRAITAGINVNVDSRKQYYVALPERLVSREPKDNQTIKDVSETVPPVTPPQQPKHYEVR